MSAIRLVLDGEDNNSNFGTDSMLAKLEEFSVEEKQQIEQFASTIDISKNDIVTNYGLSIQKQSASIASKTLDSVKSNDTGEISDLLIKLVSAIDDMEGGFGRNGVFAEILGNRSVSGTAENAEAVLEQIEKQLIRHKLILQKDIVLLDALYEENWETFKALSMYIRAGEIALEKARNYQLVNLVNKAKMTRNPEDEMMADIFLSMCNQFDNQLHNLRLTRTICLQSAPQINLIRQNDRDMLLKLQSSIVNTIPIWRQKITMSITMNNNANANKTVKKFDSLTNKMLREHASLFHKSVVNSASEAQRVTIDPATVDFVNREITSAVSEYIAIEKKGAEDRHNAVGIIADSKNRLSVSNIYFGGN